MAVFQTMERRLGAPTPVPLDVTWLACSQTAPVRRVVERMMAKATRKDRLVAVGSVAVPERSGEEG
jgi:hypothetical protein